MNSGPDIHQSLTFSEYHGRMPEAPLSIEQVDGPEEGQRTLRLSGPVTLTNLFDFQNRLRRDNSQLLILDFTNVPYIDSAGIGALVGAYVSRNNKGAQLALLGVSQRVRDALIVTQVEQFFTFYEKPANVSTSGA